MPNVIQNVFRRNHRSPEDEPAADRNRAPKPAPKPAPAPEPAAAAQNGDNAQNAAATPAPAQNRQPSDEHFQFETNEASSVYFKFGLIKKFRRWRFHKAYLGIRWHYVAVFDADSHELLQVCGGVYDTTTEARFTCGKADTRAKSTRAHNGGLGWGGRSLQLLQRCARCNSVRRWRCWGPSNLSISTKGRGQTHSLSEPSGSAGPQRPLVRI